MKSIPFKLLIASFLISAAAVAQQYSKPMQEFKVGSNTKVFVEASYAEIEIVEWNKNKIEIEGIMNIQGLPEKEAKAIFDNWDISAQADSDQVPATLATSISSSITISIRVMLSLIYRMLMRWSSTSSIRCTLYYPNLIIFRILISIWGKTSRFMGIL